MEETKIKKYELSFLLTNDKDIDVVLKHLADSGAVITTHGKVNEIRLSYPIAKLTNAYFGYIIFDLDVALVNKLDSRLKLDQKIVRYLLITPPPVDPTARKIEPARLRSAQRSRVPKPELSNKALEEKLAALGGNDGAGSPQLNS